MKNLKDVYESIFDDEYEDKVQLSVFLEVLGLSEDVRYYVDDVGRLCGDVLYVYNKNIPSWVKIGDWNHIIFRGCKFENLNVLDNMVCEILDLTNCKIEKYGTQHLNVSKSLCVGDTYVEDTDKWFPKKLESLRLQPKDGGKSIVVDLTNTEVEDLEVRGWDYKFSGKIIGRCQHLKITKVNNVDMSEFSELVASDYVIDGCKKLTSLKGVNAESSLTVGSCPSLKTLDGIQHNNLTDLAINGCRKLDSSDFIPDSVRNLHVSGAPYLCWTEQKLKEKYPQLVTVYGVNPATLSIGELEDTNKFKEGVYGLSMAGVKNSIAYGRSRGTLIIDKIKKVLLDKIRWENSGLKSQLDSFVFEGDPNPKKNWTYKNPGYEDCTGVGIEIGDEVAVYAASGAYGKSNGIVVDRVVGFTPAMVKCEKCKNRPGSSICILRSQKIAEKFYKNQ